MKTLSWMWIVAALVAAPGVARADKHADAMRDAVSGLNFFAGAIGLEAWYDGWLTGADYQPAKCTAVLAAAKKAGVKVDDVLVGPFEHHPNATPVANTTDRFELSFGDAAWICEEYGRQLVIQQAVTPVRQAAELLAGWHVPPTADDARGYNPGAGEAKAQLGRDCTAAVNAAIKGGVAASSKVKIGGVEHTLTAARDTFCQGLIDYGTAFEAFITEAQVAIRAEKAQKYLDAGISGARLELMIEYDDVSWRGKGCAIIDDVAVLARATKLFQWLENSDGTHTIRKYEFKGSKVKKVSNRTYKTEAKAYKGCK